MYLTNEQRTEFDRLAQELMAFLAAHCHPHCAIIATYENVKLVETLAGTPRKR